MPEPGFRVSLALFGGMALLWGAGCTKPAPGPTKAKRGKTPKVTPQAPTRRHPPPDLPERGALAQKILYQQAKGLLKAGRQDKAVAVFRRAIAAHQGGLEANCYLGLGSSLSDMGKKREAVEAFQKVVTLRPKDAMAYQMLAIGLRDIGSNVEAAKALERASVLEPDHLSIYQDLMALDLEAKRTKAAQKVYERYEARRKNLLQRVLEAKEAGLREDAAVALGEARDDETARGLVRALSDRSPAVRMAVIRALGQQGLAVARKPLVALKKTTRSAEERRAIRLSIEAIDHASPAPTITTMPSPPASATPSKSSDPATPSPPRPSSAASTSKPALGTAGKTPPR
ncbi:MAG: HEAT repeat domain-containing protein [Deltaproteobacteria bacterium]|nr:HEAT repeat domain-containing protein [Deltaproteobacteria bacterium]